MGGKETLCDARYRPRLLDLYCGGGGMGTGYYLAGFDVVGVDVAKQPRYPFAFFQADAVEFVTLYGNRFDATTPRRRARRTRASLLDTLTANTPISSARRGKPS